MMMMMADKVHQEMVDRNLRPRLCYLSRGDRGYGFHLHGERSHGAQLIRKIEEDSPAERAGLRSGDRVVEVNGENVEKASHQQVVQKIMEVENRTRLLVLDAETDEFLRLHSLPCTEELAMEMSCFQSPRNSSTSLRSSPKASCSSSPRDSFLSSPRDSLTCSFQNSISQSLCNSMVLSSCDSVCDSNPPASNAPPATTSPRDSITSSPSNSHSSSPSDSVTPSPSNSVTLSPHGSVTTSTSDSVNPSPHASRNSSLHETTPFTGGQPNESHVIDREDDISNVEKCPTGSQNGSPSPHDGAVMSLIPAESLTECYTTFCGPDSGVQEPLKAEEVVSQDLRPRLCHILKGKQGFGFNLHCDKRRVGHYIRSVDPDSPAERAGLLAGDRLIQVNDRDIEGLKHSEVVEIIRGGGGETKLLVVDPETDTLFKKLCIKPTTVHLNEDCVDGPLTDRHMLKSLITETPAASTTPHNGDVIAGPIIQIMPSDPPTTNGSLKHQSYGSSSSHSTLSDTSMELSNYDSNSKLFDSAQRNSAPCGNLDVNHAKDTAWDSSLRLSPTAAEARQKVRSKRAKKAAPPMAWSKKYELFSNF